MKEEFWYDVLIVFLLLGACLGMYAISSADTSYKEASIRTCNYANNLTSLINMQSDLLKSCSGLDYTRLDFLNCSRLR